jgi:hypothetical protein
LMIFLVRSPEEKAQVEQARRTRPQIAERCHYVLVAVQKLLGHFEDFIGMMV